MTPIVLQFPEMILAIVISLVMGGFIASYGAVASGGLVQVLLVLVGFEPLTAFLLGYVHTFTIGFWSSKVGWEQNKASIVSGLLTVLPLVPFLYGVAYFIGHIDSDLYIIVFTALVLILGLIMTLKGTLSQTNTAIYPPQRIIYEDSNGQFARNLEDPTDKRKRIKTFILDQPQFTFANLGAILRFYFASFLALAMQTEFGVGGISLISLYYYLFTETTGIVAVNQGMICTTLTLLLLSPIIFGYPSIRISLTTSPTFLIISVVIFIVITIFCLLDRDWWKIRDHASPARTGIAIMILCAASIFVLTLHFLHIAFFTIAPGIIPSIG